MHCGERRQASEHHEQCRVEERNCRIGMVRFIDLLGYRESTLRSDTEPAIIAIRSRVTEMSNVEDAVKGDKAIGRAHRAHSDATARNHLNNQMSH